MIEIVVNLSTAFYIAGTVLLAAAAVVYKKNGLYRYSVLMQELSGKRKHVKKPLSPGNGKGAADVTKKKPNIETPTHKDDNPTIVLDGSTDTTLLKDRGERPPKEEVTSNRVWGKPAVKFVLKASEMITYEQDSPNKGEKDETNN